MRISRSSLFLLLFYACESLAESISATPNTSGMERIVGGDISPQNAYPFLVSLEYDTVHSCSAFLISSRMIMTAAHCVASENTPEMQLFKAVFGRHDLTLDKSDEGAYEVGIKEIHIHDSFDFGTLVYDIAICELESPVSDFRPIPMDLKGKYSSPSSSVIAVGWGSFEDSRSGRLEVSDVVREVELSILQPEVCQDFFGSLKDADKYPVYPDIMQCIGPSDSRKSKGTCNGDSGGPVFTTTPSGQYVAVGIISWGLPNGCGLRQDPSINTPINVMRDWIATVSKNVKKRYPPQPVVARTSSTTSGGRLNQLPASPGGGLKAKKSNASRISASILSVLLLSLIV